MQSSLILEEDRGRFEQLQGMDSANPVLHQRARLTGENLTANVFRDVATFTEPVALLKISTVAMVSGSAPGKLAFQVDTYTSISGKTVASDELSKDIAASAYSGSSNPSASFVSEAVEISPKDSANLQMKTENRLAVGAQIDVDLYYKENQQTDKIGQRGG